MSIRPRYAFALFVLLGLLATHVHAYAPGEREGVVLSVETGRRVARLPPEKMAPPRSDPPAISGLPEEFRGHAVVPYVCQRMAGGLAFLWLERDGDSGAFVVFDTTHHRVQRVIEDTFAPRFGDNSGFRWWEPSVMATRDLFLVQQGANVTAYDLVTGRRRWTIHERLGETLWTGGAWSPAGTNLLFLSTKTGLCRLEKSTGRVIWRYPHPLTFDCDVTLNNGYLYVQDAH